MSFKYIFGCIISFPLLPVLLIQSKKIRKRIPRLPEAVKPKGYLKANSSKTLKIIVLGESTIAGVGVDIHENGFTGALVREISEKSKVSVLWSVYARSGYTTKQITKKLVPKIVESNADLIVIGLGGNDAFKLNSPLLVMLNIEKLIKSLQKKFPRTPIYFTNMPPIKEFPAFTKTIKFVIGNLVEIFGEKLQKKVKKRKRVFYNNKIVTLKSWAKKYHLKSNANIFFSDGIHPSKLSYQLWGKDMAQFIMQKRNFKKWLQKI
ncbi:SGNH/GDSL hydrolase family protein [Polaribacter batillariae]|uniref:SGNH/GDSL hydrolase family protein n=1 Tax=Polaribacter batillariae TaxID=2808900 RepID=A0ABX7SVY2_9FLAO|nr:SGNH/GDSL hydrolase family protein [Polaribacter batillariae]QTD38409.1 SGNH/GDSL hydrolase family protein [Polaribacter batillariae]